MHWTSYVQQQGPKWQRLKPNFTAFDMLYSKVRPSLYPRRETFLYFIRLGWYILLIIKWLWIPSALFITSEDILDVNICRPLITSYTGLFSRRNILCHLPIPLLTWQCWITLSFESTPRIGSSVPRSQNHTRCPRNGLRSAEHSNYQYSCISMLPLAKQMPVVTHLKPTTKQSPLGRPSISIHHYYDIVLPWCSSTVVSSRLNFRKKNVFMVIRRVLAFLLHHGQSESDRLPIYLISYLL